MGGQWDVALCAKVLLGPVGEGLASDLGEREHLCFCPGLPKPHILTPPPPFPISPPPSFLLPPPPETPHQDAPSFHSCQRPGAEIRLDCWILPRRASARCVSWACLTAVPRSHSVWGVTLAARGLPSSEHLLGVSGAGFMEDATSSARVTLAGVLARGDPPSRLRPRADACLEPSPRVMSADAASQVGAVAPHGTVLSKRLFCLSMNRAVRPGVGTPSHWLSAGRAPLQRHPEQTHRFGRREAGSLDLLTDGKASEHEQIRPQGFLRHLVQ